MVASLTAEDKPPIIPAMANAFSSSAITITFRWFQLLVHSAKLTFQLPSLNVRVPRLALYHHQMHAVVDPVPSKHRW